MKLFLLCLLLVYSVAEKISYENYKVFQLTVENDKQLQLISNLIDFKGYRWWSLGKVQHLPKTILVAPQNINKLVKLMSDAGIKYEIIIENLQALIDSNLAGSGSVETSTRFHTLDEIYDWLDSLPKKYPGIVETIIGGRSYEGRKIKGVKISFKKSNPGIFIESGIHANEWIGPATATYLINEIITSKDPKTRKLAESHNWYIFPSVNPDGYVYTHAVDRLWRKSTSPGKSNCIGVDLNRNWDYKWMEIGASNNSCEIMYAGTGPFSEIESKSLSKYIKSIESELFAYISFHNHGQVLLIPYGDGAVNPGDNFNESYAIGKKAIDALYKRYGTQYDVGNVAKLMYPVSGISSDWVKANLKLPIVYSYEMRDLGHYASLIKPKYIIPNGQEILDSFIVIFEEAAKFGYQKPRS